MTVAHILGFPRIGAQRELKQVLERYWKGESTPATLEEAGRDLRARHWQWQRAAGLDSVAVGDFSFYDHVLDTSALLGVVPARFAWQGGDVDLDTYFRMARGVARNGAATTACEMTKWFDTNYHYLVPELVRDQVFRISSARLFEQTAEAVGLGHRAKPVLLGPLSFLWLGKTQGETFDKLTLLDALVPVYAEILARLHALGAEWVQVDEPILALDLPAGWRQAFESVYTRLAPTPAKLLLTTYFGGLRDNLQLACTLPVAGLHVDATRAPEELPRLLDWLPAHKQLSLGVIDGRNIWRTDLDRVLEMVEPVYHRIGERLQLASSCSLLHVPVDVSLETGLDPELRSWLAFAVQKLDELHILKQALTKGRVAVQAELADSRAAKTSRQSSARIHDSAVQRRMARMPDTNAGNRRSAFALRRIAQRRVLALPPYPTTTIGSFPQTGEIRAARRDFKAGRIGLAAYRERMRSEIALVIRKQEEIGLDVLVHGEAERNDMVEYFGEQLSGFAFTQNGWVQSYGSRCVKPPILFGDVARPLPMTVEWSAYAQSLTSRPVKGMLTGPVTILQWSFVRDDQPRAETAQQIAVAIRDEVCDLEAAGIRIIQVDEPAFREGLPLRAADRPAYLDWAVRAFRVAVGDAADATQIHTHMCYAEFNDIIEAIAALDADVITIETSRSAMELLDAFVKFKYPNEIGPGVYDIHSPRVPATREMLHLLRKAGAVLPAENLWVNPDCGLKTRAWPETEAALRCMVEAARTLRAERGTLA